MVLCWNPILLWLPQPTVAEQAESIDNPMHEAAKRGEGPKEACCVAHSSPLATTVHCTTNNLKLWNSPITNVTFFFILIVCLLYTFCNLYEYEWCDSSFICIGVFLCSFALLCVFVTQGIWVGWGSVWRTKWELMDWTKLGILPSTGDATEDTKVTDLSQTHAPTHTHSAFFLSWMTEQMHVSLLTHTHCCEMCDSFMLCCHFCDRCGGDVVGAV